MTGLERFRGEVTWTPNPMTCYLRVSVPRDGGVSLSLKVSLSGYNYRDFQKGDWVEVERTNSNDARRFRVTRLMKEVPPKEPNPCGEIHLPTSDGDTRNLTKEKTMTDRVRFWLGEQYLRKNNIYPVLMKAFGLGEEEARGLYNDSCAGDDGFWITCRPDQFARFMIYRNKAGVRNGFMDLQATLFTPADIDRYTQLAQIVGITRDQAKRTAIALQYTSPDDLGDRLDGGSRSGVDVSQRELASC